MATPFQDQRWDTFGLLKEAFLALDARFEEVTESVAPIERSVLDLLIRVARSPNTTARPTDLAKDLALAPSHITRCLDEAERRQLVTRRAHPTDRRSTMVVLAPAGVALLAELEAPMSAARDRLIHDFLGPSEVADLERLLRQLRDHSQLN
jgi:MarR family 2-MHQ and catechol resistance regulon transcriptional repressor